MPLIWNNKEYKLVPDNSNWDKLEFVVARKLHVQYNAKERISINFLKNEFEIYGALEKIQIFCDNINDTKFAHITFKENRVAYCALLDLTRQEASVTGLKKVVLIRPADAHLQPDNPVDSSTSPFYNLPDDCLLAIFKRCDFHTLATLSTVCKKLSELLRTQVFEKIPKFTSGAATDTEVLKGLVTVSRLVECVHPPNFHLKIARNLHGSTDWPAISVDMKSPKSEISVEMDFFDSEWLSQLESIKNRIKSLHIHQSVYDGPDIDQINVVVSFPIATNLSISGFASTCIIPDLSKIATSLPRLETVCLRNGTIKWTHVINYCKNAKNLRDIVFENCLFESDVTKDQIIQLAGIVRNGRNYFPLCLMFDRIQINNQQTIKSDCNPILCECLRCERCGYARKSKHLVLACAREASCKICSSCNKFRNQSTTMTSTMKFSTKEESSYNGIIEALHDATVCKYVHVRIGRDPFSD